MSDYDWSFYITVNCFPTSNFMFQCEYGTRKAIDGHIINFGMFMKLSSPNINGRKNQIGTIRKFEPNIDLATYNYSNECMRASYLGLLVASMVRWVEQ